MDYCWLRILRQVLPTQKSNTLRVLFVDILDVRSDVAEVHIDAPGRLPGNYLQLPGLS